MLLYTTPNAITPANSDRMKAKTSIVSADSSR
jgi:hypothetical protein